MNASRSDALVFFGATGDLASASRPPAEPATPDDRSLELDDQLVDPVPEVLP